jgi:hypothetical protein
LLDPQVVSTLPFRWVEPLGFGWQFVQATLCSRLVCVPLLGGLPWQLEHVCAEASTLPFMCNEAFFQVELAPLYEEITSPWQFWHAVVEDECEPPLGGLAWQALPQAS